MPLELSPETEEHTLEECGFPGSLVEGAAVAFLYYDFIPALLEDPLLLYEADEEDDDDSMVAS